MSFSVMLVILFMPTTLLLVRYYVALPQDDVSMSLPRMGIMWAVVTLPKRRKAFKEFDELLGANVVKGLFHHDASHLPIAAFRPQLLVLDRLCDGTLWNVMQTRERTPRHQVTG